MLRRMFFILAILLSLLLQPTTGEEGMYPISELTKLNLKAKGMKIDPKELYNPKGTSLIEAIVSLGGCTGSFVSKDGLIITNHHCVFSTVQAASTVENDYLTNGFLAKARPEEIRARGLTARITEEMRDVTKEVLSAISDSLDPVERSKAIDGRIGELTKQAQKELPGKSIGISEMLAGKSYVMFISTTLRDVRLAYVPPRSIGEFGGEDDNWVWPRHTGDFSFVRAYVGPDGKPADYSKNNVPYHPKRFLKVNPNGVNEEDLVFILGYPGRTYRHQTSSYMAYEENLRMPFVADLNDWQIKCMEELGKASRAVALKFDARVKGLANTMKNYRGKLAGMKRLQLVAEKREEEVALQKFIDADPQRKAIYGTVLDQIGKIYAEMSDKAQYELVLDNLQSTSLLLRLGNTVHDASREMAKPSAERSAAYRDSALAETRKASSGNFANYYEPAEKLFFRKMISLAAQLPQGQRIAIVDDVLQKDYSEQNIGRYVDAAFSKTTLRTAEGLANALGKTPEEAAQLNDPFVSLARELAPLQQNLRDVRQRRSAELSKLSALLIDVKQRYLKRDFIPDANGTLRFTYGHVRGYSPADATYLKPITTLTGVMEKTKDEYPYATPQKVRELYRAKDYGRYKLPKSNELPVALLYDTDTTGGNSGSPLMNAMGELVGVNFDRAWGATINDYAWNEAYSRSIAVDIRYVLWVTEKVGGADSLLKEMGVK
ncbi:MAG: S46 family peptidase [Acidobacteriia bacterium]|nr:S46 family peptidase [Terriglobia bacterium]